MCLLVDFGILCSPTNELQQNSNTSSREDNIPQILTWLCQRFFTFIFDLCGLLSVKTVIRKQQLKQCKFPVDQSALPPIPDRFYIISMEFLSLSRRRSSTRNVPINKERGETDVFAGYLECVIVDFCNQLSSAILPTELCDIQSLSILKHKVKVAQYNNFVATHSIFESLILKKLTIMVNHFHTIITHRLKCIYDVIFLEIGI